MSMIMELINIKPFVACFYSDKILIALIVHKLHKYVIWHKIICNKYFLSAVTYEVREETDHDVEP